MKRTKHIDIRMNQRGISQYMIDMVLQFGYHTDDCKVVLDKKGVQKAIFEIDNTRRKLMKILDKQGFSCDC